METGECSFSHGIEAGECGAGGKVGDDAAAGPGALTAPMPGKIIEVLVKNGDTVEQDQTLIIMEAMKMEYRLKAARAGIVENITANAGEQVQDSQALLNITDEA